MKSPFSTWFTLPLQTMQLGFEAQQVIGMRLMKVAMGGVEAGKEMELMVAEKTKAALDAQMVLAGAVFGADPEKTAGKVMAIYQRKVSANRRRLAKGG